jgi:hypothetical protein
MELIKFGVSAFKGARTIEGTIDQAIEQLKAQQGQPKVNPETVKAQAEAQAQQQQIQSNVQIEQMKLQAESQIEQMKLQAESQLEQQRQQIEAQKVANEMQFKMQELSQREQIDRWKAELDASTKIEVARISAEIDMQKSLKANY